MSTPDPSTPETLFARWLEAHEHGAPSDIDALRAEHPEHAEALSALHGEWRRSEEASGNSRWEPFLNQLRARGEMHTRYVDRGEVARGGMGVVRHVYDQDVRRSLAMKIILAQAHVPPGGETPATDDQSLGRFLEEAQVTGQLDHPGVVPVHDVGVDGAGRVYFTMKLVKGEELRAVFDRVLDPVDDEWSLTRALNAMLRVCEAMAYAHAKGVIHRDLKPANVMVGRFGEVFVMDWGLARIVARAAQTEEDAVLTERALHTAETPDSSMASLRGGVAGTPEYMPPEQAQGDLDRLGPPADVYAVGAMLYHLLSGAPPYATPGPPRDGREKVQRVLDGPPAPLVDLAPRAPAELLAIIDKAMERDPGDRYPDMTALARDLRAYLEDRVVSAHETGAWAEAKKWVRRNRALAATAAVALAVVATLATWSNLTIRAERDDVLRLSDKRRLEVLLEEADTLWPEHPDKADAMRAWLTHAESLLENFAIHEATLRRIRATGRMIGQPFAQELAELESHVERHATGQDSDEEFRSEDSRAKHITKLREELTSLEAVIPYHRDYEFGDDVETRWWHDAVRDLLLGLRELRTGSDFGSTVPAIDTRLAWATAVEETTVTAPDAADAWRQARRALAVHPKYGGIDLAPQVGLVPLGPDPDSTLWEFAHPRTGAVPSRDPDSRRLDITPETGLVFVLIPGGTYSIGAQPNDPSAPQHDPQAARDEGPVHQVSLAPYFLSKYEMTQGQWARFFRYTGRNPSNYSMRSTLVSSLRHPIESVSWETCVETLTRLGLSLPTEAQWEAACRAGTDTPWSSGRERASLAGAVNLADQAARRAGGTFADIEDWPELDDGFPVHAPVGRFRPNPFGLHDMHGNVWEYCLDRYASYDESSPREVDGLRDVPGTVHRSVRGGSYSDRAAVARSSMRTVRLPVFLGPNHGVRPARAVAPD